MNLFSVTAPLAIRCPDGHRRLMAEKFPHPQGLLYFEPFWHEGPEDGLVHLVAGVLKGDGPWKVGDCVVTVAGCQGSDPEMAMAFAQWQAYLQECGGQYLHPDDILAAARARGALV